MRHSIIIRCRFTILLSTYIRGRTRVRAWNHVSSKRHRSRPRCRSRRVQTYDNTFTLLEIVGGVTWPRFPQLAISTTSSATTRQRSTALMVWPVEMKPLPWADSGSWESVNTPTCINSNMTPIKSIDHHSPTVRTPPRPLSTISAS